MAKTVKTMADLQAYAANVAERAEHHAHIVQDIVHTLTGLISAHAAPGTMRHGLNVMWWQSKLTGRWYCGAYRYGSGIEIRDRNQQGAVLHTFTNATTTATLRAIFKQL